MNHADRKALQEALEGIRSRLDVLKNLPGNNGLLVNRALELHGEALAILAKPDAAREPTVEMQYGRDGRIYPVVKSDAAVDHVCPFIWHDGYPDKCYGSEWFIAVTIHGDKVVLRALPEEWTYDYKTADETYIKKETIKKWAQFPESNFIPFAQPAPQGDFVLVPREPTDVIIESGFDAYNDEKDRHVEHASTVPVAVAVAIGHSGST